MSIGPSSGQEQPLPTDKAPTTPSDTSLILTDTERSEMIKYLSNPQDFPQDFRGWLEGFINSVLPTSKAFQVQAANVAFPVGTFKIIADDLTAQTGVYEYTDEFGIKYLYCNGAAASQTTYAALYAKWGANKWGADSGGNFLLPDTRGRSLWMSGTNTATDVGDNDGVSEASRAPSHTHTVPSHSHSFSATSGVNSATVGVGDAGGSVTVAHQSHTHSVSGTTGADGTGATSSTTVAHIVIGSMVARF